MSERHLQSTGRRLVMLWSLAWLGCSSGHGDPPGISGTQFTIELSLGGPPARSLWLLVADDAEETRPIREALLLALTPERLLGESVSVRDPAVWQPIDLNAVIVRPSQGDAGYVTAQSAPDLHWSAENSQEPGARARFEQALATWYVPSAAPAAAQPELLSAFASAQQLVEGLRPAASAGEQELLDALAQADVSLTFVHSARDDASSLEPASYAVPIDETRRALHVVAPPAEPDAALPCGAPRAATPRFAAWLDAQPGEASAQTWPCTGFEAAPPFSSNDDTLRCISRAPQIDEAGRAECVLMTAIEPTVSCPNERGWFDPENARGERVPRLVDVDGESRRLCEIVQLEGDELEACRNSWSWEAPLPGWCWTRVSEWNQGCPAGRTELALRIVGGANLGPPAIAELTCIGESFVSE